MPLRKIRNVRSLKCTPHLNLTVGVLLDHGVLLRFVLLLALRKLRATFQAKNVRSAPASSALTVVSHQSQTHVLQIVIYVAVEKRMENKAEQRIALVEP